MRRAALFLALAALAPGACGKRDDGVVRVSVVGSPEAFAKGGTRLGPAAQLIRAATVEGLVRFDAEGRVAPALADRWIVTEDGQSYIFRLRNGEWPDGAAITGESAASALEKAIAGLRGTALGLDLTPIDEIRAMAGRVVEIRLKTPMPDLLALLAQPELGLPYKGKGTGPMALTVQRAVAALEPIAPETMGLPAEEGWKDRVRDLRVRAEPAAGAVERFDEGFADIVLGGTADTLPLVRSFGLSRGNLRLDPVIGLFGLLVVDPRGFLAEPANREAIAMAIDRDALVGEFNLGGWQPTTRIVSPEVADDGGDVAERWVGLDAAARRAAAAARVSSWKRAGKPLAALRVALPATPGGTIIFDRLRADLGAIGLDLRRVGEGAPADLRLCDAVARYGRTAWFLNQLSCAADRPVCSKEGDAHLAEARADPASLQRAALLAQAEREITSANGFIPFARPLRWSLVRGDVAGFATNPWAVHPLLPLALAPR
jgi:peptide/nickel transport system substrate-binding protein/oligopeptide transport system substrate-binding protein